LADASLAGEGEEEDTTRTTDCAAADGTATRSHVRRIPAPRLPATTGSHHELVATHISWEGVSPMIAGRRSAERPVAQIGQKSRLQNLY
jgi:hypothetical protein